MSSLGANVVVRLIPAIWSSRGGLIDEWSSYGKEKLRFTNNMKLDLLKHVVSGVPWPQVCMFVHVPEGIHVKHQQL